jgi:hypothetical protein
MVVKGSNDEAIRYSCPCLEARGLDTAGKKDDLIATLEASRGAAAAEGDDSDEEEEDDDGEGEEYLDSDGEPIEMGSEIDLESDDEAGLFENNRR